MLLQQLVDLGLVTPTNNTGTFATLPYAARVTIASTVINHFVKDLEQHCPTSMRSPADVHCILESIGPTFSFNLPDCEALILQALTVYEWVLHPNNASLLPQESFAFDAVRRAEIMRDMVHHISQVFQPQSSTALDSQSKVILHAINTLSTIMRHNAKVLEDPDSPAWTSLIHVTSAAVSCHAQHANAFSECRGALATIQLEALLRSRTRSKLLWALAGDSHGRNRVPVSVTSQWRAAVQTLARTVAAATVSQPNPDAYRIDWQPVSAPVRRTTSIGGHCVQDITFALTSCLDMFGPIHLIDSHDALHEACLGVGDALVLLAGAPLWPASADDEGGARRFLYTSGRENPVCAPRRLQPGPSTPILARLFGTTLVLIHRSLPSSPPHGAPLSDAEIAIQRIKVVATERLCAAFLRPESIDLPAEHFQPFLSTLIASLEDPSPMIQGTALIAALPVYGTLLPRRFPARLTTALIIASSNVLSPHLVQSSSDVIAVHQGSAKSYTAAGGDEELDDVDIVEGSRSILLTSIRAAAASHLSNCVAVSGGRETETLVLGALLRATIDFRYDEAVQTAVLSATTLVFSHLAQDLLKEAPKPPEKPSAGPHFELAASIIDQVTKRLSPTASIDMIPCVMHFLRELPVDSPLLSKGIVESLAEFALAMRKTLDSATAAAMTRKGAAAGATLPPTTAAHLFALSCHSILRVLDRQHAAWIAEKSPSVSSEAPAISLDSTSLMKDGDTMSVVLQVVDAGLKNITGHNYAIRDAAEALLHGVFIVRQYPLSPRHGGFHSKVRETDFLAEAQSVKAFAVGTHRIVTALQCLRPASADGTEEAREYVALIMRDAAGVWAWTFSSDDEAPRSIGTDIAAAQMERALNELVPLSIPIPGDALSRTSVDAERHDAVIARWKADPPLAAALKAMEVAEGVAARAAAADGGELQPVASHGRIEFPESGAHCGLMRRLLSDLGFVSSRTKVLKFDDEFIRHLRAIDRAAPVDTTDVCLLRIPDGNPDDNDLQRFESFCASLGLPSHAHADVDGVREYVHASPSLGIIRFHARDWKETDDLDTVLAPQVLRILWDGSGRGYYHCATPTVLTTMYQQLSPQWRVPTRSVIDLIVSPLQKDGSAGGYFSLRVLSPVYATDDEVILPGQLAPPLTPLVGSLLQVNEVARTLWAVVHSVSQDKFNSSPLNAVVSAQFARKRLLERAVTAALVAPDFNDQVGSHVLAALLVD